MARQRIGFIGLGDMGRPMAGRLPEQIWPVVSSAHVRREAIEALKAKGLVEAPSSHAVARDADIAITMVRNTDETQAVVMGLEGALDGIRAYTTMITMITIDPEFCRRVAACKRRLKSEPVVAAVEK